MKIIHPFFGIQIDTKSRLTKQLVSKLNDFYSKIPKTKCINCPGQKTVEAECCKAFSPPILLIEFISSLRNIEKWEEDKRKKLFIRSLKSYLNSDNARLCSLLGNNKCLVYEQRPLSCRLFAMYTDEEWNERLKSVSTELEIEEKDVPFFNQCRNIRILDPKKTQNNSVPKEVSDDIFESMHSLDIKLFQDQQYGKKIVMSSLTYTPFDAHFLAITLGKERFEQIGIMKERSASIKRKFNSKILSKKDLENDKNGVKVFIETIEKQI